MNRLSTEQRARVITALVEGNSINSTCRMTNVAKMTVLKLLRDVGAACLSYYDQAVHGLASKKIQCDEVWSFCYAKDRNLPAEMRGRRDVGSVWTWTALDADSKLMVSWHVGQRMLDDARVFIGDLAGRLAERVQLTTDGRSAYLSAIIEKFPTQGVDYGVLLKIYGPSGNDGQPETRYSPGRLVGTGKDPSSRPDQRPERLNQLCGAVEPDHPHGKPAVYPTHQRFLEKVRESLLRARPDVHALQLLPDARDSSMLSGDGGGPEQNPLER